MKSLHYETVTPQLKEMLLELMELDEFKEFYLVGGTSLALQRGHRMSVDIDLFTSLPYGEANLDAIRTVLEAKYHYFDRKETLSERQMVYSIYLGSDCNHSIKVDLCYDESCIYPLIEKEGIRLADERDIAAMKMNAIAQDNQRQKDFWDIHDLLETYSMQDLIDFALKRYSWSLTKSDILDGFSRINSCRETQIICLKKRYWPFIIEDLQEEITKIK